MIMQPVSTCLTFKTGAETAARHYVSAFNAVFGNDHGGSRILAIAADAQEIQPCGWVKDRLGVSWQIVPSTLHAMTEDPDPERAQRVMSALYGMKKVDAAVLQRAYSGDPVSV
jgi:predicted 3-demethylubiquinone-9 3-methyltransferase (glyoxalase superfamily)